MLPKAMQIHGKSLGNTEASDGISYENLWKDLGRLEKQGWH